MALVAPLSDARRGLRRSAPHECRAQEGETWMQRRSGCASGAAYGGPMGSNPDYNRKMARNTPYAEWYARVATEVVRPDPEAPGMVSPTDRQQRVDHERSAPPIP